jgi:hypothetical protein
MTIISAPLNTNIDFKHVLRFGVELFRAEGLCFKVVVERCLLFILYV